MAAISDDSVVCDEDLAEIADKYLEKWEDIFPYLKLLKVKEEVIRRTGGYEDQKKACLKEWKKQNGCKATFGALIEAASKAGNKLLADNLKDMEQDASRRKFMSCTSLLLVSVTSRFMSVPIGCRPMRFRMSSARGWAKMLNNFAPENC